jgi:putative ABC transport system permease protein
MLLGAVLLVVLAVAANVTNLLIARGVTRSRDIALQVALGAGPRDLALQTGAEATIIAALGGLLAIMVAHVITATVLEFVVGVVPRLGEVRIDGPVLAFTAVVLLGATAVAAALPIVQVSRLPPVAVLREARSGATRRGRRAHQALIVLQIATSFVLLVGTALLGRSLAALLRVDPGVNGAAVSVAKVDMTAAAFVAPTAQTAFLVALLERIGGMPGVERAGLISSMPPDGTQMRTTVTRNGVMERELQVEVVALSAGTTAALGMRLERGRTFTAEDTAQSQRVLILSETAAHRLFPDRDAVGQTLPLGASSTGQGIPIVVGVVGDVHYTGLASAAGAAIYLPFAQRPFRATNLIVRSSLPPEALAATVQKTVHEIDPGVAVGPLHSWTDVMLEATAPSRVRATILVLIAGLSLGVSGLGLYSVMAYAGVQRTREFAVRMAIGATCERIVAMVVQEGLLTATVGIACGCVGALTLARVMSSLVFGISVTDAVSFVLAAATVGSVALLASLLPAWRAARLPPVTAMKLE